MNNKDKKFLKKHIIDEIIKPEYDSGKKFILNGFNIPIYRSNEYSHVQVEKRLQWLTHLQLEALINEKIIEENINTDITEQHNGYILDSILFEKISLINKNHIDKFIINNSSFDFNVIAKKIHIDFLKRIKTIFDLPSKTKNIQLHKLYFNENKELYIKINDERIPYNVIDVNDPNNNKITIIKEKKLCIGFNKFEFPDFAIYYNGLPFISTEMKRPTINGECGTIEAANDYHTKLSNPNFLGFIGTNGLKAFISCNPNILEPYIWENYPDLKNSVTYYDETDVNGFYDILCEIVTSPKNLLFYFESCTMLSETGDYLKNARIQQYFTVKKVFEKMLNSQSGFKTHFQHHTRTGKSFTFKIIAKLAYKKMNFRYKKCIFFTHDVSSVLPSVTKEFRYLDFPNGQIEEIKGKKDYQRKLSTNTIFGMYITNMQKITKKDKVIDASDEVLIFIDEVHTHQGTSTGTLNKNTMADLRKIHFPNATIISATASPIMEEQIVKGEVQYRNITAELHGPCIDKVTPSDAVRLNLVTKLHFSKENFQSKELNKMKSEFTQKNEEETEIIENEIIRVIEQRLIDGTVEVFKEKNKIIPSVLYNYNQIIINKCNFAHVVTLNPFIEKTKEHEQMFLLLNSLQQSINLTISRLKTGIKSKFKQELWKETLKEKIENIVIPEVRRQRDNFSGIFTPKFFYVVNSRMNKNDLSNGEMMLIIIKEMIMEHIDLNPNSDPAKYSIENNIYKGVRFGFDSSENENDNVLNGDLDGKSDITALFEVEPLDNKNKNIKNPCDVLILVRKKLMGYDNKNLTTVFLDKDIDESNIKEMLQLATRGTTKREGKNIGYIKDLTFGDRNIETFRKAFSIYDSKDGVKEFIFEESDIISSISRIKDGKDKIVDLFIKENISDKIKKDNILTSKILPQITEYIKSQYWKWRNKKESDKGEYFIEKYITLISRLEQDFKSLISPVFLLESKNEQDLLDNIFSIFRINYDLLLDIKNKNTHIYKKRYTNEEIVLILEKTFSSFGGVNSFMDKMQLRYKDSINIELPLIYETIDRKNNMSSTLGKLRNELNSFNNEISGRIGEALEEISHSIDTNEGDLDEQATKIERYKKKIQELKEIEKDLISSQYNDNRQLYKICEYLKYYFNDNNTDLLFELAKNIDRNILKERKLISEQLNKTDLLNSLINKVNFNDVDFIKNDIDRWKLVYENLLSFDKGIISKHEKNLKDDLDKGIDFEYMDNSNIIFNILKEYI